MASKKDKKTSRDVASDAAKLLASPETSPQVRSVAGSALAQTETDTAAEAEPATVHNAGSCTMRGFKAGKDL